MADKELVKCRLFIIDARLTILLPQDMIELSCDWWIDDGEHDLLWRLENALRTLAENVKRDVREEKEHFREIGIDDDVMAGLNSRFYRDPTMPVIEPGDSLWHATPMVYSLYLNALIDYARGTTRGRKNEVRIMDMEVARGDLGDPIADYHHIAEHECVNARLDCISDPAILRRWQDKKCGADGIYFLLQKIKNWFERVLGESGDKSGVREFYYPTLMMMYHNFFNNDNIFYCLIYIDFPKFRDVLLQWKKIFEDMQDEPEDTIDELLKLHDKLTPIGSDW